MRTRIYDFREAPPDLAPDRSTPPRRLGLHALVLALVASGVLLYLLGGPPHLPVRPDAKAIVDGLRSADPPLAGAASWCFALAWALWLWTVGSLLAQAAMVALERVTGGAAWVLALRPAIAPFLMPLARRAFPVLTAGVIVIRLATSPTPGTAAAPAPIILALPGADLPAGWSDAARGDEDSGPSEHLVVEGDTLWALAERYYGDGSLFSVLHEANLGRPMPDGTRYEGRLRPGQLLLVPPAATTVAAPEEQFVYTVARGDTLRAIAARFLGDEMRWPEIFALNRDVAALPDGRTLTDPDLIWPGLRLTIPAGPPAASPAPGVVSPAPPVALPSAPPSPSPSPSPSPTPLPVVGTPSASTPTVVPTATTTPSPAPAATPAPASPVPPGRVATAVPPPPSTPRVAPPRPAPPESPVRLAPGRAPLVVGAGALGGGRRRRGDFPATSATARPPENCAVDCAPPPRPRVAIREVRAAVPPDFADGDLLGTFTHRAHGGEVEAAVALAHHAARFFAEEGLDGAIPLLVAQGAHGDAALLVGAPRAERDRVVALAPRSAPSSAGAAGPCRYARPATSTCASPA